MEYRTFDDLRRLATVSPAAARGLSRRARLGRWARLLQEDAERRLEPLRRLEFMPKGEAEALRCDNSPISIAFADPVLRAEGLAGDRFGDVLAFFELSPRQAHYLLCDCYYQGRMTAGSVARRIRSIANRLTWSELWSGARGWLLAATGALSR